MKIENVDEAVELIKSYDKVTRFIKSIRDKRTVEIHFPAFDYCESTVKIQLPYEQAENVLNEEKNRLEWALKTIGVDV